MAAAPATPGGAQLSVCLIAGEPSGDLHGASLCAAMVKLRPSIRFWGVGADHMAAQGVELVYNSRGWASLGVTQALAKAPVFLPAFIRLRRLLRRRPPHLLVLIDFGALNTKVGRAAKATGIKTLYYFPPRSWDRNLKRPESLREVCHRVVTPFPWSAQILRAAGIPADCFGHPMLDLMPAQTAQQARAALGLPEQSRVVGLFPGSRMHEVRSNTAVLLGAADLLRQGDRQLRFLLSAAPGPAGEWVEQYDARHRHEDTVVTRDTWAALAASDAALLCSGSITLQAAALQVPMVVFYRGTSGISLQYVLFYLGRVKFIAMPNVIAQRQVVPEFLGGAGANSQALATATRSLLEPGGRREEMLAGLREVAASLGAPGAVAKTAALAVEMAES